MNVPFNVIHIIIDKSSQQDQYRWLFISKNWFKWISKKFNPINYSNEQVFNFAKNNQWIDVINSRNWHDGIRGACYGGHLELAKFAIHNNQRMEIFSLYCSCRGGNIELVNIMIHRGSKDWGWGLRGACRGGHLEIAKLMMRRDSNKTIDWAKCFYDACYSGYPDLAKLMIQKSTTSLNIGLSKACEGSFYLLAKQTIHENYISSTNCNHLSVIKLMIQKGATQCSYCNKSHMSYTSYTSYTS
jgi:hypothetical protein